MDAIYNISGDFSTATVTVYNNSSVQLKITGPMLLSTVNNGDTLSYISLNEFISAGANITVDIILYNGYDAMDEYTTISVAEAAYQEALSGATSTGDVYIEGLYLSHDAVCQVSGPGTITIS